MLRYVILTHDHPVPHWDFLLEAEPGGALRSWRLLTQPASGACCPAEPLPDHRRLYLDYEGPVSGDRGTVAQFDAGTYTAQGTQGRSSLQTCAVRLDGRQGLTTARLTHEAGRTAWIFE